MDNTVISALNDILADEMAAIATYMTQSATAESWGYKSLSDALEKRAIDEMRHAERIIDRIVYFNHVPTLNLSATPIGTDVQNFHTNDRILEAGAIKKYNNAIALCEQTSDGGTAEIMRDHLEDEEAHIAWIEAQIDQINQMGIVNYLTTIK